MNKNSKPKYMAVVKPAKMTLYKHGAISTRATSRLVNITGLSSGRRKNTGCFSLAARRRLRSWVVSMDVPDSGAYALTLTLPADGCFSFPPLSGGPIPQLRCCKGFVRPFPETINRFGKAFRRLLPHSGFVWRVELQKRGAPHLHCLVYVSRRDFIPEAPPPPGLSKEKNQSWESGRHWWLRRSLCFEWWKTVLHTCWVGSFEDADDWLSTLEHHRGFDLRPLWNQQGIVRYIVDDMSKHKQEQLGYIGAQWGVVARSNWRECRLGNIEEYEERVLMQRVLGKIRRRRQDYNYPKGQFPKRLSKYFPADCGATYCNENTLIRLRAWVHDTISQKQKARPILFEEKEGRASNVETILRKQFIDDSMVASIDGFKYLPLLADIDAENESRLMHAQRAMRRMDAPCTAADACASACAYLDLYAHK